MLSSRIRSSTAFASGRCRRHVLVKAQQQTDAGSPRPTPSAVPKMPPRPGMRPPTPGVMLGPDGQPLEVVPVEKTGEDAWAGVAAIDRGEADATSTSKALLLAGGDAAFILLFAVIGRINHGELLDVETLNTALPFWIGWFATAPFLGGFGKEAQGSDVGAAAGAAAKCWAAGIPLGLAIRGLSRGYVPPTPFIVVSLATTLVLLVGWRALLAKNTAPPAKLSPVAQAAARKDKQGNPFEFMMLLISLVKRW
eukprot:CAMPEP_0202899370 /NCGR_PEP_ID=MMETSP1392-20130828/7622_1 /ASSEMBLY_ACC=CAM_ASM_000868 /TAXON_ID=225041 /ORGANISM="Chlamydomonas chlamydogama, Strain SAG 11-48b" /LENGTH=251 /DNA_ID=CAMNT_0049585535 /DNA_START=22 /DNA_END=777 /DNA_ORIENTATION=-